MTKVAPLAWAALGAGLCGLAVAGFSMTETKTDTMEAPVAASTPANDTLKPDAAAMAHSDIRVASLVASQTSAQHSGFARTLDVGALAAIDAEAKAADAATNASRAEAARLTTLYAQDQSASRRSVEAAQAQAQGDVARAQLASRRVGLEFGPGLLRLGRGGISALVSDVAAGRAALVRIDIAGATLLPGATVRVGDGDTAIGVRVLGAAASADTKLQSAGVLAIVRGSAAQGLLAGRILPASADSGAGQSGVIVPRDAIVRYQGGLWVYVQKPDKRFDRVEIVGARAVADGWFVTSGLAPGTQVAVAGAGSLMAMERSGEAVGDEE
jgi:catechol 2,3-dioxygenase-like lactoylglutathione lyase family enzyme